MLATEPQTDVQMSNALAVTMKIWYVMEHPIGVRMGSVNVVKKVHAVSMGKSVKLESVCVEEG